MAAALKELKEEIVDKLEELPKKDIKELYNFIIFLEMKSLLPQIDPTQAYFWTKKWQKNEKDAEEDLKKGRVCGPFNSTKELAKSLKK